MLRPSYLKEARAALAAGQMSMPQFKRIEDRAVDQVIATQEGAGVEVVTDGEMRRFLFMAPITETVSGIELVEHGTSMPWASPEGETEWTSPMAVTSKLQKRRSLVCEEYSYARGRARRPLKVTVPSPLVLYGFWNSQYSTAAYADPFAMFADAAEVGRRSRSWWRSAVSTSRSTRLSSPRWSIRESATGPRLRVCRQSAC
jgi:5-methyltetrahydropteroyltriglutamate--homocysteine methyltransferase